MVKTMVKHFLSEYDLNPESAKALLALTGKVKKVKVSEQLKGKTLVMFFEKASTRTRISFEVGMTQLGGHAIYMDKSGSQISRGESVRDTALTLSRYCDVIMARVFKHETVEELARYATVPVINGLSDKFHPCQSMADVFTILEKKRKFPGLKVAYIGDGNNNVAHSLMLACSLVGADIFVASPKGYEPLQEIVDGARKIAGGQKSRVVITDSPEEAAKGADVIYTDVWVSMGREEEKEQRLRTFRPFQINSALAKLAKPDFIFMHCLPAHVGEEVTEDVIYSKNSVVFDQAENRLHVQKAIMLTLLKPEKKK